MLITNHVLCGALIGLVAPNAAAAFGVGLASHFAMDAVPHYGEPGELNLPVARTDGLIGLSAMALATISAPRGHRLRVFAGMVGACLPDVDKPAMHFFGFNPVPRPIQDFHERIQPESKSRWPQEIAVAAAQAAAFLELKRRVKKIPTLHP